MFKSPIIPWVLAVFGITMAVLFSIRADRALKRAETAESQVLNRTILESQGQEMLAGTFVGFDDLKLTFKVPVLVKLDGKDYTDVVEQTNAVSPDVRVVGVPEAEGLDALGRITPGAAFRYRSVPNEAGAPVIFTVVVNP